VEVELIKLASTPIFHTLYKCPEYLDFKQELLNQIKVSPSYQETEKDSIYRLDFTLAREDKKYLELVLSNVILPTIEHQANLLSFGDSKISLHVIDIWFQQYIKNDIHKWHTHPKSNFNNIFYLEKPDKVNTEFYCPIRKEIYIIDNIQEGDILTFPGHVVHRSGLNTTTDRKTVIAFNSVIDVS